VLDPDVAADDLATPLQVELHRQTGQVASAPLDGASMVQDNRPNGIGELAGQSLP
jgi:hypothetical protein